MPIRWRLALFGAAVVALALAVFGVLLYSLLAAGQARSQEAALKTRAAEALRVVAAAPASQLRTPQLDVPSDLSAAGTEVFVEVLDRGGAVLLTSGRLGGGPPSVPAGALGQAAAKGSFEGVVGTGQNSAQVLVMPWSRPDSLSGYVVTGQSVAGLQANLAGISGFLLVSAVLTLIAALLASWLVAGRALRPLQMVATAAGDISATADLSRRLLEPRRDDELGKLARSFNGMLDRLQGAYQQLAGALDAQRRFVADASHELRTPLTTIRANAGMLAGGAAMPVEERTAALADIAAESERMGRLVEQLLTLARADSGARPRLEPVDLRSLAEEVCRRARPLHPGRSLTIAGVTQAGVRGDADSLSRLLWILLDNAFRHTAPGGSVEVGLHTGPEGVSLTVRDDGEGIPAADLERVFTRFYRADPSRSGPGSGLGLAIGRRIAEQHRGLLWCANNADRGVTFVLRLPALT